MLKGIQDFAERKAYRGAQRARRAYSFTVGLTWIQVLILLGVLLSTASVLLANYVAFTEGLQMFDLWYLPGIAGVLAFFLVEGIALVFLAGWISNNTRRR